MRKDLVQHFTLSFFAMLIFYKIPNIGFILLMGLGILKEYGYFDWAYWVLGNDHIEIKDVDDIAANYLGALFGYILLVLI